MNNLTDNKIIQLIRFSRANRPFHRLEIAQRRAVIDSLSRMLFFDEKAVVKAIKRVRRGN